ncbi:MAG: ABC transporter substrate-binding protein [Candidatus Gracilibacteria bacterium]|nr:ABC transporter substrate-binding protein [Candidatus Gracilibacteria bacterium]
MIYNKIIKLKKYLFLISVVFFVISLTHLVYMYIYDDSKIVPIKGGTVSEGLIGGLPSLNPLKPLSGNNKYIINLLYRSLLKFDLNENKIVGDLATCDISNMLYIECFIKDNIFWSNGDPITPSDVVATYGVLKNSGVNKIISSLLLETEIIQKNNSIVFKNTKKDVNFLNIFFQPILPKETLDTLGQDVIFGNFPTSGQIYSGEFKISNITTDLTIGITKIFLDTNEYLYKGNISKLIINIFQNTNSLLQNKETINIFEDTDNIIGDSIPRLKNNKYTLPQYVALFINQNNVSDIYLRNYILEKINTDNLVKVLGASKYETVKNPYLTDKIIDNEIKDKNFEKIISNLGYIKKSKIIENRLPIAINSSGSKIEEKVSTGITTETKKEENVSTGIITETKKEIVKVDLNTANLTIDKYQQDSKYITSPAYVDKYNFITKDDVLLQGNAGVNVSEVYVNDYKLANFKSGSDKFYYRLAEKYGTIKGGINTYKIYFVENGKKNLKEELTFIFYRDKNVLNSETNKFIKSLYEAEQKIQNLDTNRIEEINKLEEKKRQEEANKIAELKKTEQVKKKEQEEKKSEEIKKELEVLNKLNEKYYYNDKLEIFTLDLYYLSTEKQLETTAQFIKDSLLEIGIEVQLFPISITDLRETLSEKSSYDMVLTGVNLGYFDYNIFPYFHSSQLKSGYNFSNIKKTSLDILLEDLKSGIKTQEEMDKTKDKVLEILKAEKIVKTLYTPKINLLIDKNIKNVELPSKLVNNSARKEIFNSMYTKEEKIINFKNKGIVGFFNFLFKKLND